MVAAASKSPSAVRTTARHEQNCTCSNPMVLCNSSCCQQQLFFTPPVNEQGKANATLRPTKCQHRPCSFVCRASPCPQQPSREVANLTCWLNLTYWHVVPLLTQLQQPCHANRPFANSNYPCGQLEWVSYLGSCFMEGTLYRDLFYHVRL